MKRRQTDGAKLRRPLKRTKIGDGVYSSILLYLKFLFLWAVVILADFILEFRFEFLWPFWMLLRSVYDSFKYQGLAFSVFFVCIALTSDMICFFFIPVQWVFFAASTYVWVQYIWYTDKGICLPTMILCSVFVYMEAGIRLRDSRHMPAHLDLCRPFAAHCIGYPVVTLGFGFKSYVGYKMRKRRQQEVARENSFYMQLLQQALPPQEDNQQQQIELKETKKGRILSLEKTPEPHVVEKPMNGNAVHLNSCKSSGHSKKSDTKSNQHGDKAVSSLQHNHTSHNHSNHINPSSLVQNSSYKDLPSECNDSGSSSHSKNNASQNHSTSALSNHVFSNRERDKDTNSGKVYMQVTQNHSAQSKHAQSNGVVNHMCNDKNSNVNSHHCNNNNLNSSVDKNNSDLEKNVSIPSPHIEKEVAEQKHILNVETNTESDNSVDKSVRASTKSNSKYEKKDVNINQKEEKRRNKNKDANREKEHSTESVLKHSDSSKENESSVRGSSVNSDRALRAALAAERQARAEITQLRQQNEQLTAKLNTANANRQTDRAALATAERQLNEERRARQAVNARLRGLHSRPGECVWEWCRQRKTALEQEVNTLRDELQQIRDHNQSLTQSLQAAEQQVTTLEVRSRDNESWHVVQTLKERISHLELSLSAETRVKLDLFSAVGEGKRQLDIREEIIRSKDKEIEELKLKFTQLLGVMPSDSFSPGPSTGVSKLRLSDSGVACYASHLPHHNIGNSLTNVSTLGNNVINSVNANNLNNNMSNLDPNATAYTPKGTLVQCSSATEA